MSAQLPPDVIIFPGIDYNASFYNTDTNGISQSQADKRYLKFRTAQGDEILLGVTANGVSTFNNSAVMNSFISFKDNLTPFTNTTTAYKSSNNLVLQGQNNNSGLVVINKDNAGNNENSLTVNSSLATLFRPLRMNNNDPAQRSIMTSYLQLTDITNPATYNNDFQMYHSGVQTYFTNSDNGGVFGFYVRDSSGTTKNTILNTFDDLTITTTNTPTISASVPSSTDSSTKIATTAWVQGALNPIYTYPQKWLSSLARYSNSQVTNAPTFSAQSIDIILPYASNMTNTGIGLWGANVRVLISTQICGYRSSSTSFENIYSGSIEMILSYSLRNTTATSAITWGTSTNLPASGSSTMKDQGAYTVFDFTSGTNAAVSQTFTPITIITFPNTDKNKVRITFNQFTTVAGRQASIFAVNRSAEILSCTLNSWTSTSSGNFDTWNVMTYPNKSTTLTGNFADGTQNMSAYIAAVSTNY
jgi:hypothetical protein